MGQNTNQFWLFLWNRLVPFTAVVKDNSNIYVCNVFQREYWHDFMNCSLPHNIFVYISNIPLCSTLHLIYNVRICSVFCVFNLIYLYAVLLLILFWFCFLSTLSPIWKTVDGFIERKAKEKQTLQHSWKRLFFVYCNVSVWAISLVEIRCLRTRFYYRKTNILLCESARNEFLFVCLYAMYSHIFSIFSQ